MVLLFMDIGSGIYAQSILPQINGDPVYLTEEVFIAGGCFDVSNAAVSGGFGAVGTFSNGENSIGISSGIILSTGSVLNASGPNTQTNYTTNFNNNNADPDLEQIIDNPVIPLMDVAILEFDFTPTSDYVTFEYVFASEEYCDFVNTLYNDVFGFFISGPGINGSFSNNAENIALVPGTADFVAINNINHLTNASYYIDNVPLDDPQVSSCPGGYPNSSGAAVNAIEFDGFTQVLTASSQVIPCETYHIKLVIGDVTDGQYDSAVFLGANSFEAGETVVVDAISPATGSNLVFEGCGDAYFLFQRFGTDLNVPLTVDFVMAANSTAVPGVDYEPIPLSVTFPQGVSSVSLPLQIFSDDMVEGQESLGIELESACSCFTTFAEFIIEDGIPLQGNLASFDLCGSETLVLQPAMEGGIEPYEFAWSTGESSTQISMVPTHSETITLLVTDACGSSLELFSEISFTVPPLAILSGGIEYCGEQSTGTLWVEITGEGDWELSYRIDGVLQQVITLQNSPFYFQDAAPGIYSLDHIEHNGCPGSVSGTGIVTMNDLAVSASVADNFCFGQNAGSIILEISGGDPQYVVDWSNGAGNVLIQTDLPAGSYSVAVMDAGGCMIDETFIIGAPAPLEVDMVVQPISCYGADDGSLTLLPSGGNPPYFYSIFDFAFQNESTFGDLTAGGYEIHLKDAHDCQIDGFVFMDEPELLVVSVEYESPVCLGMSDGHILVNATGGTGDYRYRLNGGAIQNDPLFADLPAGQYTLEVSDTHGCQEVFMIDLVSSPPFSTSLILTPSTCPGVPEGVIEVLVTGGLGQPVYSLNGNAFQEVNVFSALGAGTYVISVMDESGCVVSLEALLMEPEWPAPEITGNAQMCTGTTQELSIIGSGQYYWSNGAQGNLAEIEEGGHYEVTVVDENGCLSFADFWVEEIPEPVVQIIGDNILCPGETSLLTLNETFGEVIWSDGTTGSEMEVQTPGTFSAIVVDQNGCIGQTSINVYQNPIPPANITGSLSICDEGVTWLGLNQPYVSYFWSDGSGESTIMVETPGTFSVTVNDINGCWSADSVMVEVADFLSPVIFGEEGICPGDSVVLATGSGFNSYLWSNGASSSSIVITAPGVYSVTVDDGNNCTGEASLVVEEYPAAVPQIMGEQSFCFQGFTTLYLSGDYEQYSWSEGSINPFLLTDTQGWYVVTVTDDHGCVGSDAVFVSEQYPSSSFAEQTICAGETWWFNGEFIHQAGTYFDTLFNASANGCDSIIVLALEVLPPVLDTLFVTITEGDFCQFGNQILIAPGIYSDTLMALSTSCDSILVLILEVHEYFSVTDSLHFYLCEGEEFFFNGFSYQYPGIFWDTLFSEAEYLPDSIFVINIEVRTPVIEHQKYELCRGDSIYLDGHWQFDSYISRDTFSNIFGCDSIVVKELEFSDLQVEIIEKEPVLCFGDASGALEADISGNIGPVALIWSNGASDLFLENIPAGIHSLFVRDSFNCQASASIVLGQPDPIDATVHSAIQCQTPEGALLTVDSVYGGVGPYFFALDEEKFQLSPQFTVPAASVQKMIIEDVNGCRFVLPEIRIDSILSLDLSADFYFVALGDSVQLRVVPNFEPGAIKWADSPFLSCLDCPDPFAFPEISTTFSVQMQSPDSCMIKKQVTVFVDQTPDVYAPTAFSPNGDGVNDHFTLFAPEPIVLIKRLDIFDRWGNLVFRGEGLMPNQESEGWDGTFKGKPLNQAVFAFKAILENTKGVYFSHQGEVLLLRK